MYGVDYTKVMFGEHAMHVPCRLVLQNNGRTEDGKYITVVVGVIVTPDPIISQDARDNNYPHELVVGDMVVRPQGKWASGHFRGHGVAGLLMSEAMLPSGHEIQTLDNGFGARQQSQEAP